MDIKRFFVYAIVIAALALAGCSSDGNGGDIAGMPDTPPPPPEPTVNPVDLTDLPGVAIPTNTVINAGESMNFGTGQDEVTISCPSGGENCSLTQTDDSVTSTGGMATAMLSEAAVTARRNAQMAMTAAATKAAETKEKAIAAEVAQNLNATTARDAGLGGDAAVGNDRNPGSDDDLYSIAITYSAGSSDATVKINDSSMAGDDDPKFTQSADLGGGRTMHVRQNEDGSEEVVVVATGSVPPTPVAFAKFENVDGTTPQALNGTLSQTGVFTAVSDNTATVFQVSSSVLAATDMAQKAILDNMKSASFSGPADNGDSVQHTFLPYALDADSEADGNQTRDPAMISGTYNGAMCQPKAEMSPFLQFRNVPFRLGAF